MKITSKNAGFMGTAFAFLISFVVTVLLARMAFTTLTDFLSKLFPLVIVFFCLVPALRFLIVSILSLAFNISAQSYGTYTNQKLGFSIDFPQEWEDVTAEGAGDPELVVHARTRDRVAGINIIAGPQPYGPHPSIGDLEVQARKTRHPSD